ncbi:lactadherin-like [Diadema antillarum]|uniref:lactadherin-like n=1 Tax=Diadema antillarum TaxID=105358 RepID=UPI003A8A7257
MALAPRYSPDKFRFIHQNGWTANASRLVCQYLGFRGSYATVNGNLYGESSQDAYAKVGAVSCPTNATNITDCWIGEETNYDVDATIGIVCCSASPSMSPGSPLGLESGAIPDSSITASSYYSDPSVRHEPQYARLNGPQEWCTSELNTDQWLQVQFKSNYLVSGIVTQGRVTAAANDRYVTSYKISSSVDNLVWTEYMDPFTGSVKPISITTASSVHSIGDSLLVSEMVGFPILACRLRLLIMSFIGRDDLNHSFEVDEDKDKSDLGTRSDDSGKYNGDLEELLDAKAHGRSRRWCRSPAKPGVEADEMEQLDKRIDLGEVFMVTGVITQGRKNQEWWVTSIHISTSLNDIDWIFAIDPLSNGPKVYPANYDRDTHVTSLLPNPLRARYVRIHPITFMVYASMRVEVLGRVI